MITIGTDPELFAYSKTLGKYVSGHTMIPGTKQEPFMVEYGAVQKDGLALEFNTFPAASTDEFVFNIRSVMSELSGMVPDDIELRAIPTVFFDKEYFDALPDKVRELGCEPDFNAYTGKENSPPCTTEPFRTGAGHIHVGLGGIYDPTDSEHFDVCRNLVKQLDVVLFPVSKLWDKDEKRRELYGNMGSFRPKFYGVEYRPLSNAYLNDDKYIKWVFDASLKATELLLEGEKLWLDTEIVDGDGQWYLIKRYGFPELPM